MLRIMSLPINIMKSLIGGNMEIWSLDEKKTDMMFNDKPVYMKSFIVDGTLSTGYELTKTGDIDRILCSLGTVTYTSSNAKYPVPYTDSSSRTIIYVNTNNNLITSVISSWHDLKCTIWYTKTTD